MKLIFMEYLSSLRERDELDVIMPDLLSELGMNVLSKPGRGNRQYGVDIAAVGDDHGIRSLFLLSIKRGDLTRSDWDTGEQALRPSLNEILDVYIPTRIPSRYADYPVVVVPCLGGDVAENVWLDVKQFMQRHETERVRFQLWNGGDLADRLLSGVLRENTLPSTWRSDFRKCLAMVDEARVSFEHFCRLATSIVAQCKRTRPARLKAARQIYIALWTLYVWSRRDGNIESAFLCGERATLICWALVKDYLGGTSKLARQLNAAIERLISLYQLIATDYVETNVVPRAGVRHGLASAVPSQESLDVNLRLFDVLGRIGLHGLWQLHKFERLAGQHQKEEEREALRQDLTDTAELIMDVIAGNGILRTPIKDNQVIDIDIACLFLSRVGCGEFIQKWVGEIVGGTIFAFNHHGRYPCIHDHYRDLLGHPSAKTDKYRIEATAASVLVPTLAVWAALMEDARTLSRLADFVAGPYRHATLQLLFPGTDTEERLYEGGVLHGLNVWGIDIPDDCEKMIGFIREECQALPVYWSLSAQAHGLWPLVVLASRHHRTPLPPHLWPVGLAGTEGEQAREPGCSGREP